MWVWVSECEWVNSQDRKPPSGLKRQEILKRIDDLGFSSHRETWERKIYKIEIRISNVQVQNKNSDQLTPSKIDQENLNKVASVTGKCCRYHKRGYCKYNDSCKYYHSEEICKQFLLDGKVNKQNIKNDKTKKREKLTHKISKMIKPEKGKVNTQNIKNDKTS